MNKKVPRVVDWSCYFFARLVALLPRSFRQDYDQPILQAFRDLSRDAWQAHGLPGLLYIWVQALPDLVEGVVGEWQLAFTIGGYMERDTVRSSLLMALVVFAIALVLRAFPPLDTTTQRVVEFLILLGLGSVVISGWRSRHPQPVAEEAGSQALTSLASGISSWIRALLIGLELVFLILFLYALSMFRIVFPWLASSPFFPPVGSFWPFMVVDGKTPVGILILLGAYLAVTRYGAHYSRAGIHVWLVGVISGLITGVIIATLALAMVFDAPSQLLVMFVTALLVGLVTGAVTGQIEAGALGGFGFALACGLTWSTIGLVVDIFVAPHLGRTPWLGSHMDCLRLSGNELIACAIGGDYSIWGRVMLELPILGSALGIVGGLMGTVFTRQRLTMKTAWVHGLVTPVLFCGGMVLLFFVQRFTFSFR